VLFFSSLGKKGLEHFAEHCLIPADRRSRLGVTAGEFVAIIMPSKAGKTMW
jgi:hypothetical protein